jgi:DNA-binding transcriptional ArsR family regulator
MFKRKNKRQNEIKKTNYNFEKTKEKRIDTPVHLGEEGDYAILEPFDASKQKKDTPKVVLEFKKETHEEEIKPKLIIKKTEQKEVESKLSIQNVPPKLITQSLKSEESISKIPINHIETDIDKLMKIIDEKKIVGIEELSKALKISPERLEIWAKILEDGGLIEIEYPIIGLPKLRKKGWKTKS